MIEIEIPMTRSGKKQLMRELNLGYTPWGLVSQKDITFEHEEMILDTEICSPDGETLPEFIKRIIHSQKRIQQQKLHEAAKEAVYKAIGL